MENQIHPLLLSTNSADTCSSEKEKDNRERSVSRGGRELHIRVNAKQHARIVARRAWRERFFEENTVISVFRQKF